MDIPYAGSGLNTDSVRRENICPFLDTFKTYSSMLVVYWREMEVVVTRFPIQFRLYE